MLKSDFHMHTSASDGKLSPEELINAAKAEGLDIIAVTDHDTTAALKRVLMAGEKAGVKVIPGIELSTIHNDESIHILGYFRDNSYDNEDFQKFLKEIQEFRVYRAKKFIHNLYEYFHIDLDYEEVSKRAKGVIARPHIAKAIIDKGYPYSWDYIFENIIGKNSPAYVHNKKVSIEEGIHILKSLNALVILAHPVLIKKTPLEEFMKYDFDGIEAVYFLNSKEEEEKLIALAESHGKLITNGSDFHGNGKEDTKHGYLGSVSMKEEYLQRFIKELFG